MSPRVIFLNDETEGFFVTIFFYVFFKVNKSFRYIMKLWVFVIFWMKTISMTYYWLFRNNGELVSISLTGNVFVFGILLVVVIVCSSFLIFGSKQKKKIKNRHRIKLWCVVCENLWSFEYVASKVTRSEYELTSLQHRKARLIKIYRSARRGNTTE